MARKQLRMTELLELATTDPEQYLTDFRTLGIGVLFVPDPKEPENPPAPEPEPDPESPL